MSVDKSNPVSEQLFTFHTKFIWSYIKPGHKIASTNQFCVLQECTHDPTVWLQIYGEKLTNNFRNIKKTLLSCDEVLHMPMLCVSPSHLCRPKWGLYHICMYYNSCHKIPTKRGLFLSRTTFCNRGSSNPRAAKLRCIGLDMVFDGTVKGGVGGTVV